MKKYIDWIECRVCGSKDFVEITTKSGDDNPHRLYEGDVAKCEKCDATGEVFVIENWGEPVAEIHWNNKNKMHKLIDLCIEASGGCPDDVHYEVDFNLSSDSIVVRKVIDHNQVDMAVSSACDSGADCLMNWIYTQEAKDDLCAISEGKENE